MLFCMKGKKVKASAKRYFGSPKKRADFPIPLAHGRWLTRKNRLSLVSCLRVGVTDKLLVELEIVPLEFSSARKAAEISGRLAERGQLIDYRDVMIAAVAVVNDLTLVTRNSAHFRRVKELKLQTW
jgi:hypothetical protein